MSRTLIAILVVTNLATGYQLYVTNHRYQATVSDKVTDRERDVYGTACVDWLNGKATERGFTLALGRSWKKHGQLIFEIIPASDKDWTIARDRMPNDDSPSMLCTYDKQSRMMYPVVGEERERWMFY
ncbi:hypothetical protein [Szabonella alba]|uniref:Uncharacterized protein n=1 Tax=Szabonella alba TaxID=2804194 RepID=A0A8K0Y0T1_9RHOB|nr:hypothetical protein [Szabonella alba]MBL4917448.1 hypothetical protein [Szabonella alba]